MRPAGARARARRGRVYRFVDPYGPTHPTDYLISYLPADTPPERRARMARMRWNVELDYKHLEGELALDLYKGRFRLGWYHDTALVTAAPPASSRSSGCTLHPAAGLTLL